MPLSLLSPLRACAKALALCEAVSFRTRRPRMGRRMGAKGANGGYSLLPASYLGDRYQNQITHR